MAEQKKSGIKGAVIGIVVMAVIVVAILAAWRILSPTASSGEKEITLEVVYEDSSSEDYTIQTDAEYLLDAIDDTVELEGEEGEYGYTLYTVNGVTADWNNNVYWAIYVNGEYGQYAIDQQPVADGDEFQLVYESF